MLSKLAAVPALVALVLSFSSCGGDDEPTEKDVREALVGDGPKCSEVWVEGKTIPKGYEGCFDPDSDELQAVLSWDCEDGREFISNGPGYGIVGEEVHLTPEGQDEPDTDSAEYQAVFWGDCMGGGAGSDEPSEEATEEESESPSAAPATKSPAPKPAANATPDCVTEDEFAAVETGATQTQVEKAFRPDVQAGDLGGGMVSYVACDFQHAAIMKFAAGALVSKEWSIAG